MPVKHKRVRGFGVTELVLAIALGVTVILAATRGYASMNRSTLDVLQRAKFTNETLQDAQMPQKIGRTALQCEKITGQNILQCQLTAGGWVRFRQVDNQLVQERAASAAGPWTLVYTINHVEQFTVCDENDMDIAAGGTCSIPQNDIGIQRTLLNPAPRPLPLRFYRYRIQSSLEIDDQRHSKLDFQSSFFVRNGDELLYQ